MEEDATAETSFSSNSDICQQLLNRYSHSSAAQHRHLSATAAATRFIIQSSSLPLSPLSYFAATITSLSNSKSLDSTAIAALTSFLSIVIPLVNRGEIKSEKAKEAVRILVRVVDDCRRDLGTSSVRAVVKCVGILVAEFCDSKDWDSVSFGFEWLVKYSLDKRPKVRKCAQDCLLTVFKSFDYSATKKASKLIYSLLKDHMPLAVEISASDIVDGSKTEVLSRPEHQEVLHLLNVMKHIVPHLSLKFRTKTLSQLSKMLSSQFSAVTRHIFEIISVIYETSGTEVIVSNAEDILKSLLLYISSLEKNPVDTVLLAATLAKTALDKLHDIDNKEWTNYFSLLTEYLAGVLSLEADVASQASTILRELIDRHIDRRTFLTIKSQQVEDEATYNAELKAISSTCTAFYNVLSNSHQIPNEPLLSIIALLFLRLGEISHIFMKSIILELADLMNVASASASETKHLQDCIGSAVAAMGPEKVIGFVPISLNPKDFSCSNVWLIPILKRSIAGSSLHFFMEHIVPLAESFGQASHKVKKSVTRQDLQAYAHGCWGLLPAFCRQPSDIYQSFAALAKLLIPFLKKDSFMLQNIAFGLQELVNQNKSALASNHGSTGLVEFQRTGIADDLLPDSTRHVYSRKILSKNIKALASCSKELLQALTTVFLESPPEERKHLKGAISCLVSISDSSLAKKIFVTALEKFQLQDDIGEHGRGESEINSSADEEESSAVSVGNDAKRCIILELASCIVEGSDEDLINLLFCVIQRALQASDDISQVQAYETLSRILENHSWFCSSQFAVVMDMLSDLKSSANIALLKKRFACLEALLIQLIMTNMDEENTQSFLILNEIILALKDSNEEGRKSAYDTLNGISSKLRDSSDATCDGPYHKLITMLTGYLSGSSPQIKSGVVSALSVFIYNDPHICITMPDIVPSVMELLHSKAIEVIKGVLGFVKVLVSCLKSNDLQHFLSGIMDEILRWSSISRHHFKTKVTVILEIMIRKCGTASVKALAPEKYKDFVLGVVANRHGKTNSKEAGDTKQEHSDMSHEGQQKRKRGDSSISRKEEEPARPWKRKRENRQNSRKVLERVGHSEYGDLQKGKSNMHRGKRNLSSEKKHEGKNTMKRSNEGKIRRPTVGSKFSKHKKLEKKGQKIS
ncbi:hypothetical protein ACJIZ3_025856 [Penstemon smallii]|uniref:Ribosomal RNA-processing protein 12-like conserved domain-containing protein n=1 Tax=Penstemon smallii TaxID=265156 RepID=A0ABD3TW59_9LAMI